MPEPTRGNPRHGVANRGEVGSRRGEVGLAGSRAPCPRVLHPKRGKAKELGMCPRLVERAAGGAGSPPWH
eukprot:7671964-Pyramimonas_sp.AAC.1